MKKILVSIVLITPLALQTRDMPNRTRDNNAPTEQQTESTNVMNKKYNSTKLPNFVGELPQYFDTELGWIIDRPEFSRFGTTVLIVGEKGTGKTLVVNEIIKESGLEAIRIPVKEIYDKPILEGYTTHAQYIKTVIKKSLDKAKQISQDKNKSVIIFIDDLDYAFPGKKSYGSMCILGSETLPNIKKHHKHIKFIATATNINVFPKDLPYRRLDVIPLSIPDYKSRKAILEFHIKKHLVEENINLPTLALASHGFSGGDLVQVINNAAKSANSRNHSQITQTDLWTAFKPIRKQIVLHQWEGAKQSTQNFLIEYGPTILAAVATIIIISLLAKKKNKK